jgi:hypothetical protein
MSFLMGLLSGASKQYVENIEAEREQEMEMAQLRATKQAAADKRAVDLMSKASFYLTPGEAMGLGIADRNRAALVANQDIPFFSYVKDYGKDGYENEFTQTMNLKGSNGNLMGLTLQIASEKNPYYLQKYNQLRGAQVQAARRIYDQEAAKLGVEARTLRRQTILNRLPNYDSLSPENQRYVDGILAEAANLSVDQGRATGLIPQNATAAKQPNGDVVIEPDIQQGRNGKKVSVRDISDDQMNQINSIVIGGANTYADVPEDTRTGTERVARQIQQLEEHGQVAAQDSINAILGVSAGIKEGFVERSASGTLYLSPVGKENMQVHLDPIFSQVGFGSTVQIVQAALPNSFVPSATGAIVGAGPVEMALDDEASYYKRLGRKKGDFDIKAQQLDKLYSTATVLKQLIEDGGNLGGVGALERFRSGFLSQARQLFSSGSAEDVARLQQAESLLSKVVGTGSGSEAEAVIKFLSNELAYNVARSLESETGNARLSQTDVERAAAALSLEGIFISDANALAVLTVIIKRTEYERELASIMASGDIPKMQAAQIVRDTYGTERMIRVKGLDNTAAGITSAFNEFLSSVKEEAGINTTQATPNAQPNTGFSTAR